MTEINRESVSLACLLSERLASRFRLVGLRPTAALLLSLLLPVLFPLTLTLPAFLSDLGTEAMPNTVMAIFLFWPSLCVASGTFFAFTGTRYLIHSDCEMLSIADEEVAASVRRAWLSSFGMPRQVAFGTTIGIGGAIASFYVVHFVFEVWLPSLLAGAAALYSGFFLGLGFFVGTFSPSLSLAISRSKLNLFPFTPATTPGIRQIGSNYGKTLLAGVFVGVILCVPLLYLLAFFSHLTLYTLIGLAVIPAWLIVLTVYCLVHLHLHAAIVTSQNALRFRIQIEIRKNLDLLHKSTGNDLEPLGRLLDLDAKVLAAKTFVVDFALIAQAILSLLIPAVPFLVEVFRTLKASPAVQP